MESGLKANLRRIACISAAACIWEKQLLKVEIKRLLVSLEIDRNLSQYVESDWDRQIKVLIKQISQDLLTPVLYRELLSAVAYMGLRIYTWFCKLKRRMFFGKTPDKVLFENYTKKIYWTHDGTIDEVKIFKMFWLNNPDTDVVQMYTMACSYCLEEEVEYFWGQILSRNLIDPYNCILDQVCGYDFGFYGKIDKAILKYWADTRNPSNLFLLELPKFAYGGKFYGNIDESVEENMVKLCAKQGNLAGFRYFWYQLDDEKRKAQGVTSLKLMLKLIDVKYERDIRDFLPVYVKENYHEMSVFLFQNLTESEKRKFIPAISNKYFNKLLLAFMDSWPWQESSVTALGCLLPYCHHHQVFENLGETLNREVKLDLPVDCSELQRQLYQFWHLTRCEYKFSLAQSIVCTHLTLWDLSTLKFILNDKDIIDHREKILQHGDNRVFLELMDKKEVKKLEQFFCELLVRGDLKESDQKALKTIYKLLLQNDLSSVDNFLNKNIPEDRARALKEALVMDFISFYCIKTDQFDLADRILLWVYESTEKVKEYKKRFKDYKWTMKHILDVWTSSKTSGGLAVSRCDNFLNWLANFSKEEICQFKTENFTEKTILEYYDFRQMDREFRDKFLSWCLTWSVEKIEEFKEIVTCVVERNKGINNVSRLKIFKND